MKKISISGTFSKRFEVIPLFCFLILPFILFSCSGGGGDGQPSAASAKDITAFSFTDAANSALTQNVTGVISGTNISVTVPNGTSRMALVATFSTTGQAVRVGGVLQESGVTAHDFTGSVYYTVTAQDASTKTYTVMVSEAPASTGGIVADHLAAAAFDTIPSTYINAAKTNLHIAYGHTSHGSQLVTGMNALASANSLYAWNNGGTGGALDLHDYAMGGDAGYYPDWVNNTRSYLGTPNASGRGSNNPDVNVVIWSWCGQVSSQTQQGMIDQYLAPMSQLEADYWGVRFVYMTGHLDGGGSAGNLHLRNQQIRNYCSTNNKILFDFADIESYDPTGATNFMLQNATDACTYSSGNWATEWITANPTHVLTTLAASCGDCAHSEKLNCALKGRAVWWLWARLTGWNP